MTSLGGTAAGESFSSFFEYKAVDGMSLLDSVHVHRSQMFDVGSVYQSQISELTKDIAYKELRVQFEAMIKSSDTKLSNLPSAKKSDYQKEFNEIAKIFAKFTGTFWADTSSAILPPHFKYDYPDPDSGVFLRPDIIFTQTPFIPGTDVWKHFASTVIVFKDANVDLSTKEVFGRALRYGICQLDQNPQRGSVTVILCNWIEVVFVKIWQTENTRPLWNVTRSMTMPLIHGLSYMVAVLMQQRVWPHFDALEKIVSRECDVGPWRLIQSGTTSSVYSRENSNYSVKFFGHPDEFYEQEIQLQIQKENVWGGKSSSYSKTDTNNATTYFMNGHDLYENHVRALRILEDNLDARKSFPKLEKCFAKTRIIVTSPLGTPLSNCSFHNYSERAIFKGKLFSDLAANLHEIHTKAKLFHRDISTDNIIYANNQLSLIDWGLAISVDEKLDGYSGTIIYASTRLLKIFARSTRWDQCYFTPEEKYRASDDFESLFKVMVSMFVPGVRSRILDIDYSVPSVVLKTWDDVWSWEETAPFKLLHEKHFLSDTPFDHRVFISDIEECIV